MHGLHHYHLRGKGVVRTKNTPLIRALDKLILLVAILNPLFILPQAWAVWSTRQADGVSLASWSAFFVFALFWLTYGLAHKEKPLILTGILSAAFNGMVALGVLLFR